MLVMPNLFDFELGGLVTCWSYFLVFNVYLGTDATGLSTYSSPAAGGVKSRSQIEMEASAPAESRLEIRLISVLLPATPTGNYTIVIFVSRYPVR